MPNQTTSPQHDAIRDAISVIEDWVTPDIFCERFPNIPKRTLNWQLTTRHRNGLGQHVQIIGKKRFISIRGYARWLEANMERVA